MAGRPRIYENPEELDKMCEDYFSDEGMIKPTITGLSLHLGFADKTTLYDYRDRPEFSHSIKKALTKIEKYHEEALSENNVAGRIFALKNMGWKDKTETEHSGPGGSAIQTESKHIVEFRDFTDKADQAEL